MSEFTPLKHIPVDLPVEGEWKGLRIGQTWCRRDRLAREFPIGRVCVTDLVIRRDNKVVKFVEHTAVSGSPILELGLDSFVKEFVRQ